MEERTVDLKKAVREFGGYSELARRLEVPLSTCHGWARRGHIPGWRHGRLVALADAEGKDIFKKPRKKRRPKKRADC